MFRCAKFFHDIKYKIEPSSPNGNQQNDQFLDRAFIRRWKTKIYRYLDKERNINLSTFENYSEDGIFSIVKSKYEHDPI